jgi:hypothetical protein
MELYGNGRVALLDDPSTAERLGWTARRRSAPLPEFLLSPVRGDPALEPWIAHGRTAPGDGPRCLWESSGGGWTYLADTPGVDRYLKAMEAPAKVGDFVVGVSGLGRVGGTAAAALAAADTGRTRISTLLIHDTDSGNLARMEQELGSVVSWRGDPVLPRVQAASLPEMLRRCDAFVFAAATAVPPLGAEGDVRLVQFGPNREALAGTLAAAAEVGYTGLFLVISDPVELMAMAAFHDSNRFRDGFLARGLAPERVAGLALGVMWGRAQAVARARGEGERVARSGAAYGPHSQDVLVFDDPLAPDPDLSQAMTLAARAGNYQIRDLGFIPYLGPALSSIALTLPALLAGREVLASTFVDGFYFGAPSRLRWGLAPTRHRAAAEVQRQVAHTYQVVRDRMNQYGLLFSPAPSR